MEWRTSISTIKDGMTKIRGKEITDISEKYGFAGAIYFIITGRESNKKIERLLNVMFSLLLDHGLGNVSTMSARLSASSDVSLQQSLIAAIASFGHLHGAATEDAAKWFYDNVSQEISSEIAVRNAIDNSMKIPGYGHRVLDRDERAQFLYRKAKEFGFYGKYCEFSVEAEKHIENIKLKQIPLNIDGAVAAVGLELGFKPGVMTGLFIMGRLPGLIAHIQEEKDQKNGLRRLDEQEINYEANHKS